VAKVRSPSYPSISLKEAIEKVTSIYEQNYQSPVPRHVAAELMGYGSLNGKSLGVLAALSKYGLIEGRGDDTRVSDVALAIIAHEPGTPERALAIADAASRPELFAEIDARFNGGKASDAAIRSWLMTQKFIPPAAEAVVRSYRETKQLVANEPVEYAMAAEQAPPQQRETRTVQAPETNGFVSPSVVDAVATGARFQDLDDPYEVAISGNSKTGKQITGRFAFRDQQSVDDLISILDAMKAQLPKATPDTVEVPIPRPDPDGSPEDY
jgi:hypothetical protein